MHASPPLFYLIFSCFTLAAYAGMYEPTKRQTNITELLSPQCQTLCAALNNLSSCTSEEQSSLIHCVQCELDAAGQSNITAALQSDYSAYLQSCAAALLSTTLPVPTSTTPPGAKNTAGVDAAVSIITWAPALVISMLLVNNL
ncbi:hypothetical protein A0H81_06767 [Grifola frondosa]|uniref:Uncharacterized protein n=1 Tax=Grifola frondosa TaxID=5627 RepID=A0A1C7ME96_GRIFR|nr:hypothetical protein A0H81_06767 [Grifola frondosa]